MSKTGQYDGIFLGGFFGLLATTPKIAEWTLELVESIVPSNWLVLGDFSLSIIGVAAGMLIGLIVDKTK